MLPFLENSSRPVNISQFRGRTAAIDAYCWLHKGAFGCSEKLARGEDTNGYVLYCMKYLRILQNAGVRPIMVFDGQHLPAKRETEQKRREQRQVARKRAAELLRLDRANEARNYLRQCIDVTHEMALAVIKECRQMGVDCIVAPYEADAQLAYLNNKKIADLVITEDSDLVLFGCNKILFKMDLMGNGTLVETEKLYLSMQMAPDTYTFDKFRNMCVLSGCDYIQSLPGIGLKKALKFVKLTANPDIYQILSKLPAYLNMRQVVVTDEYREEFMVALATFKHQIVYNPLERKLEYLTDPEACGTNIEHCRNAGDFFDEATAFQLALGNLDPFSLKKVDDWNPDKVPLKPSSIWSRNYQRIVNKPQPPSPSIVRKLKSTKNIDVTIDLSLPDRDDDFEEELKIYKAKKLEKVEEIDPKAKQEEETIVQTTVVQRKSFNPFIRDKKIVRTVIDPNRVVKSRFFGMTNSHSQENSSTGTEDAPPNSEEICNKASTSEFQENFAVTQSAVFENSPLKQGTTNFKERFSMEKHEKKLTSLNLDTLCDIINTEEDEENSLKRVQHTNITHCKRTTGSNRITIAERFSLRKDCKKVISLNSELRESEQNSAVEHCPQPEKTVLVERRSDNDNNSSDGFPLDKRKRLVSTDDEEDNVNDSNSENLTPPCCAENTAIEPAAKKSNIGPCRSVGLQKKSFKKVSGKNQPTLLSIFAVIRK